MNDVVSPLTDDERSVLEIAYKGGNLAPIGRWERPVLRLAQLGLLRRYDQFNYYITDTGRAEHEAQLKETDRQIAVALDESMHLSAAQIEIARRVEEIARALAEAGRLTHLAVGDPASSAVRHWGNVIIKHAIDIVEGRET